MIWTRLKASFSFRDSRRLIGQKNVPVQKCRLCARLGAETTAPERSPTQPRPRTWSWLSSAAKPRPGWYHYEADPTKNGLRQTHFKTELVHFVPGFSVAHSNKSKYVSLGGTSGLAKNRLSKARDTFSPFFCGAAFWSHFHPNSPRERVKVW